MGYSVVWCSYSDTVGRTRTMGTSAEMKMESVRSSPEFVNDTFDEIGYLRCESETSVSLNQ